MVHVFWDRKSRDLRGCEVREESNFPDTDGRRFYGRKPKGFSVSPDIAETWAMWTLVHALGNIVEVDTEENIVDGDYGGSMVLIQDSDHPVCRIRDEWCSINVSILSSMLDGTDNATCPGVPTDDEQLLNFANTEAC